MTTDEASQILREMILATLDDDDLAEMGELEATYALRRQALNTLEAERDRYESALEQIELMDPDWALGVDENMSRLQSIAGRALKGGGDGH